MTGFRSLVFVSQPACLTGVFGSEPQKGLRGGAGVVTVGHTARTGKGVEHRDQLLP